MAIQIVPYTPDKEAAAKAFNRRLRAQDKTEFLLDEHAPALPAETAAIRNLFYVAADNEAVRGGLLTASYPAAFATCDYVTVLNYREPLSEGIIDSKYSLLGLRLLKFVEQQGPYIFALGMGSESAPFPRLLRGAGWAIRPVPFLFRVLRAKIFLTELQLLRADPLRRLAARWAAISGTGSLAFSILQRRSWMGPGTKGFSISRESEWGSWAEELWQEWRPQCSFGVRRDVATLKELYRLSLDRSEVFLLKRGNTPVGWLAYQLTQMKNDKYFGNMSVATILDAIAEPDAMRPLLRLALRELAAQQTDVVVTNQSHSAWIEAFRSAGFLSSRSNYILATNKRLTEAINAQSNGWERIHFTRGDGDGRYHL